VVAVLGVLLVDAILEVPVTLPMRQKKVILHDDVRCDKKNSSSTSLVMAAASRASSSNHHRPF